VSVCVSLCLSVLVHMSVCLPVRACAPIGNCCASVYMSVCVHVHYGIVQFVGNVETENADDNMQE
jgi:hypothetical protein